MRLSSCLTQKAFTREQVTHRSLYHLNDIKIIQCFHVLGLDYDVHPKALDDEGSGGVTPSFLSPSPVGGRVLSLASHPKSTRNWLFVFIA